MCFIFYFSIYPFFLIHCMHLMYFIYVILVYTSHTYMFSDINDDLHVGIFTSYLVSSTFVNRKYLFNILDIFHTFDIFYILDMLCT